MLRPGEVLAAAAAALVLMAAAATAASSAELRREYQDVDDLTPAEKPAPRGAASLSGAEEQDKELFPVLNQAFGGYLWEVNDAWEQNSLDGLKGIDADAATLYQDMPPEGVIDLLRKAGYKRGERFYDLGAGPGKTIALAWMLGLNASGVELSEPRVSGACDVFARLRKAWAARRVARKEEAAANSEPAGSLSITQGSFSVYDFSDGDVVLVDIADCQIICGQEYRDMVASLVPAALRMKPGSRIISSIKLPMPLVPRERIVAECRRAWDDGYEAATRDARLKQKLCGYKYYVYRTPASGWRPASTGKKNFLATRAGVSAPKHDQVAEKLGGTCRY